MIDDYAQILQNVLQVLRLVNLWQKSGGLFQPHGYGPTRFLRQDFVEEISNTLRENDEIWMSEIFYAMELL